ncbi:MAG: hypothetical protein ACK56B_04865 [Dolichospermum sp.]|jgi:hypothetical protein
MRPIISKKSNFEIIPVGNENTGIIYLEKRGSLTTGESMDIGSIDAKRQRAAIIASKLVKKISVDRGVTIAEAQELLSPTRSADGTSEIDNSDVIYDYIEDFTELNALSATDSTSVSIAIATLLIKKRVAFPVQLIAPVTFNSTSISVHPFQLTLQDKQVIRFGDCLVTVVGNYASCPDHESLLVQVEPVTENLPISTGFLYDKSTKSYVVGTDNWTEEDTKDCSDEFVSAIYEFYEKERSRWQVEVEPPSAPVEGEQPVPLLTGETSTGVSNPTELPTLDLETGIPS